MFKSRFAALGLVCLVSSACTVVIQPAPKQPEPRTTEPEPPPRQTPVRRGQGSLGIAPGHLPGSSYCRVWIEGTPAGRQARARACEGILAFAPEGSWILYRPASRRQEIRVRYLHATKHGMVIAVRVYEVQSGRYLRDLALGEDDDNMGPARPTISRPRTPVRRPPVIEAGRRGGGGNQTGQADTTKSNRGNVGENRGNTGNQGRGNGVGQADSTKSKRGNVGENRGNGGNQGRGNAVGQADSTKSKRGNAGDSRGNAGVRADTVSARGEQGRRGGNDERGREADRRGNAGVRADTVSARGEQGRRGGNDERGREADRRGNAAGQADTTSNKRSGQQVGGQVNRRGGDEKPGRETDDRPGRRGEEDDRLIGAMNRPPLEINARYFPNPGECRVWVPGRPTGRQARAASCDGIADGAPAGAMILRRSPNQPNVILVDFIDEARAGRIVRTSAYDANSGAFVRDAVGR